MSGSRAVLRPRSLRARLVLGGTLLLALVVLNIGAFYGSARERERAFVELRAAMARHSALTEAMAALDEQAMRVKVVSDLLGVEGAGLDAHERADILHAIDRIHDDLAAAAAVADDPGFAALRARVDSLSASWKTFYETLTVDPGAALAEVVLRAEPLARALLTRELPAVIRDQHMRVEFASQTFERTDRTSYRLVWSILLASVLLSGAMAWSITRDLLDAIGSLKTGAERFAAAELDYQVAVENFDELAEVGASLNTMASRLRSAREELESRNEELALLAFRDALTKLANRALFRERVERALQSEESRPEDIAVLFLDLDNFKTVNDTWGHALGDRLLVEVATRLLHATRGCDTVARLGGDEFAILLDVRQGDQAIIVAERIIATLRKPFSVDDRLMHVSASVGLAWGRAGETADELLRNADVAMYTAKSKGRARYEVFAPAMHSALMDRLEIEADLRSAIANGGFVLEYQPILDLGSRTVTGYEALVRWEHPRRGRLLPGTFIPIAEESGAILPLGRWVLEQACREAAQWQRARPDTRLAVHVNVSSRQLDHPLFIAELTSALASSSLEPERLVLEITESVIMRDSAVMLERLRELKRLGIRLAIDDFGTGYSSLAYLQRFPVDIIKIDKAFVKSVAIRPSDAALARTIIMLSETLGLRTVAEGIEYHDQHVMLQELGCQQGQGFLFAAPGPADEVLARIDTAPPGVAETPPPPPPAGAPVILAPRLAPTLPGWTRPRPPN